ncbi:helix-turn-helix domain-containing protein [Paracoccus aestuariivivens]|uniref:helix-turn-helix domain-containing protein n=1 Tax=Paracoccus aestuariivivens TaxID=1820333 RepID=UPI001B8C8D6D
MAKNSISNEKMEYLGVSGTRTIRSTALDKSSITATRLTRDTPDHGFVDAHVQEDAFMLAYQLQEYQGDLWVDGKAVDFPCSRPGHFTFYDYRRSWQANMKSPFDVVNFYIPRNALAALSEDMRGRIEGFSIAPGQDVEDPTIRGLVGALRAVFDTPSQCSQLFFDHVGLALCMHLAATYGEAQTTPLHHPMGLAPWQVKRAQEMIDAKLDGELLIADLASACGLSVSYFTRAFKIATGMPPYKWMTKRRIDKAMDLLKGSSQSISEIALNCGFADQSHFTRVFTGAVGASPGKWRRGFRQ